MDIGRGVERENENNQNTPYVKLKIKRKAWGDLKNVFLSQRSIPVKRRYDQGNSYKVLNLGLAYSFRGLVHNHYGEKHTGIELEQ